MKKWYMSFGQTIGYTPPNPERTAKNSGKSFDSKVKFQEWPNLASMAKSIRMQQSRAGRQDDWRACVPLTDSEGY